MTLREATLALQKEYMAFKTNPEQWLSALERTLDAHADSRLAKAAMLDEAKEKGVPLVAPLGYTLSGKPAMIHGFSAHLGAAATMSMFEQTEAGTPVVRISPEHIPALTKPSSPYLRHEHVRFPFYSFFCEFEEPVTLGNNGTQVRGVFIEKFKAEIKEYRDLIPHTGDRPPEVDIVSSMLFVEASKPDFNKTVLMLSPNAVEIFLYDKPFPEYVRKYALITGKPEMSDEYPEYPYWSYPQYFSRNILDFLTSPSVRLTEAKPKYKRKGKRVLKTLCPNTYDVAWSTEFAEGEGSGDGAKHSYRYDVRGNWARFTKGPLEGRRIWRRPHQRGLKHEAHKRHEYVR